MDHRKAIEIKASERYLLGEMTELEQHLFEEHYFSCEICAEDVRAGLTFREATRSVFAENAGTETGEEGHLAVATLPAPPRKRPARANIAATTEVWQDRSGWFDWLRPSSLIPLAASVSFACITAWQGLVTVPNLRNVAAPAVAAPVVLASATRGELPVVNAPAAGLMAVSAYPDRPAAQISFELRTKDDTIIHSGSGPAPAAGAPLVVFLPVSVVKQPGEHKLLLRESSAGASGSALGEYRFLIERR